VNVHESGTVWRWNIIFKFQNLSS